MSIKEGINFLIEVKEELKKVTWPSKELVKNATIAVIVFTLLVSLYLWGLDIIFSKIITFLLER
ncbi:preprotein translocase subunit SecE [Venenivibrio stagnispumantis]|uniref:Protein translocase subunit SecE n=1 Tax=Venenivibrio stagnispumantis TaxID=407998 RepID=A0AA46AE34_9AQUI|nr:preprotein translocase subunit SecE [Venenivibrio stagnispumantis]MCW4573330.1 preprotein translocase subunit SecE [Venenivibrio stagnispumantis]SMP10804.1 preprotein translocase subunit SecE [Venenivibrio stagnispumantis]